jgi:hypothetical protein
MNPFDDYVDALAWALRCARLEQQGLAIHPKYYWVAPRMFVKDGINKWSLNTEQKIIIFRFLINLENCKDIEYEKI